jgi:hypothetical protein
MSSSRRQPTAIVIVRLSSAASYAQIGSRQLACMTTALQGRLHATGIVDLIPAASRDCWRLLTFCRSRGRMIRVLLTCSVGGVIDGGVDTMRAVAVRKPALKELLANHRVGTWVVLNCEMSRVLGAGKTPARALKKANVAPVASDTKSKRPVMLQVPDPSMVCFF